jgi:hypothetical protein
MPDCQSLANFFRFRVDAKVAAILSAQQPCCVMSGSSATFRFVESTGPTSSTRFVVCYSDTSIHQLMGVVVFHRRAYRRKSRQSPSSFGSLCLGVQSLLQCVLILAIHPLNNRDLTTSPLRLERLGWPHCQLRLLAHIINEALAPFRAFYVVQPALSSVPTSLPFKTRFWW